MIPRRSGRKTKKPEIFQPTEDIDTEEECYSDESDLDDDSDADEDGNLKGFIVDDESESEDA
jgi:hypothetical protein